MLYLCVVSVLSNKAIIGSGTISICTLYISAAVSDLIKLCTLTHSRSFNSCELLAMSYLLDVTILTALFCRVCSFLIRELLQ